MILEIDNIELSFGLKKILSGIYLKAETDKVIGLLGKNGCGKTSLLRIIFGDLTPKYKNLRIDQKHLKKRLFKTKKAAYLPQHQFLPNSLKIRKAFSIYQLDWQDFVLTFPSFKIHSNSKINELSSGEIRVIETYLILHSGKKIILLDEPFSFISPIYIDKFKNIIGTKKKNSIIVITDHFYREVLEISDKIYLLNNGATKKIGSKLDLKIEGYL